MAIAEVDGGAGALTVSRRAVFSGLFFAAAVAPISAMPEPDLHLRIKRQAEALAASLTELHGGDYWIHVDHGSGVVAVSRVIS